jgi:cytochrome P450
MKQPPGPTDWLFGMRIAMRFRGDMLSFVPDLQRQYGDAVYYRMGPFQTYFFFHPDQVREVLVAKAKHFRRWELQSKVLRQWDGNGLVISEGDTWLRQRRLMQPAFHPRHLEVYVADMVAAARRQVQRWQEQPGPFDIVTAMTDLTLEIIAWALFHVDVSKEARRLGEAVAILSETAYKEMSSPVQLPDWLPIPSKQRKRWATQYLDDTIRGIIRDRRASGQDKGDLLSRLLLAVDEEGDGQGMTDEQARDESMVLFLAGHDTSAAGLAWVWYLLAKHPHAEAKVAEEVERVLQGRPAAAADLPQLRYTEMVVKEALRLYPPTTGVFARYAAEEVEIGGYPIPKGGIVYLFQWVTQRDARWFPEPAKFDPERFAPGQLESIPQYAWFPFGGGPRVCIGNSFAMMEMILVVATIVQQMKLALAPGQGDAEPKALFSLRPRDGVKMTAASRANVLVTA